MRHWPDGGAPPPPPPPPPGQTGVLQNYARQYRIEIDALKWDETVMASNRYEEAPESGCYITGLYLEGAAWNPSTKALCESAKKVSGPHSCCLAGASRQCEGDYSSVRKREKNGSWESCCRRLVVAGPAQTTSIPGISIHFDLGTRPFASVSVVVYVRLCPF